MFHMRKITSILSVIYFVCLPAWSQANASGEIPCSSLTAQERRERGSQNECAKKLVQETNKIIQELEKEHKKSEAALEFHKREIERIHRFLMENNLLPPVSEQSL